LELPALLWTKSTSDHTPRNPAERLYYPPRLGARRSPVPALILVLTNNEVLAADLSLGDGRPSKNLCKERAVCREAPEGIVGNLCSQAECTSLSSTVCNNIHMNS
jgi:hypothetical protein